ncbi:hypothetical protein [Lewinella cohaerens]|uniref:hypothetical protein n=1 Tax=Lewinella cohaerens TaxID=70995 RepID=UPI000369FC14|nr:hypothetical protein [Lewinella cohaerens]
MGNLLKMFFSQPEIALQLLIVVPGIIAIIFLIRLGHNVWSTRASKHRGIIVAGIVLFLLSHLLSYSISMIYLPYVGGDVDHTMLGMIFSGIGLAGNTGEALLFWGLYQYFSKERTVSSEKDLNADLIQRY